MESFDVSIEQREWNKEPDMQNIILKLFNSDTNAHKLLKTSIERENNEYGGSPEVEQFSLESISYNAGLRTGKFRVVYYIKFHFTCSDYRKEKNGQTSDWTFTIDISSTKLHFEGPAYLNLRSTADEF